MNMHYVLSISDTQIQKNGYSFIKDMILQNHNHSMNVAYEKLKQHEIQVCSVKTDVLVIDKCNLDKAQSLLKFGNGIGTWTYCNGFRSPSQPL